MRTPVATLALCLLTLPLGTVAYGDDVLPPPAPAKRYEKLAAHSPFAPPSAGPAPVAAPVVPPGPTWSDNLTVTSLMQLHGVYTATVSEKSSPNKYFVRSDVEDRDSHLMVASVRWADRPEEIKVTLRKGTEFGDVHFDASAAGTGTGTGTPMPGRLLPPPARAGMPNPGVVFHQPPAIPTTGPAGGPANAVVRGRPIRSAPPLPGPPGLPGMPGRPAVNRQAPGVRAGQPGGANKDDDDDDDN